MMPTTDLQAEESLLGNWPRRLLHVPTMVSYEWQLGNVYGHTTEPEYNAITYTWGRWKLRDDNEEPSIKPLTIHGTPWKIPRVHPHCFTSNQLSAVLNRATRGAFSSACPVEFVWLDIACIDQQKIDPRSTAKIGRQAAIFSGAKNVFAWMSSIRQTDLEYAMGLLEYLTVIEDDMSLIEHPAFPGSLAQIYQCLQTLTADPWFSSLRTLQEAFLRQDAIILSREGMSLRLPGEHRDANVLDLIRFCEPLSGDLVRDSGDEDRVYGIQQIFGFRLGTSNISTKPGSFYTREELEIQLGEQLLLKHPILSQMHVFPEPAPVGRGWLVSRSSTMPHLMCGVKVNTTDSANQERPMCVLSVQVIGGYHWGRFEGPVSSFSLVEVTCRTLQRKEMFDWELGLNTPLTIHLDKTDEITSSAAYQSQHFDNITLDDRQWREAEWLSRSFSESNLCVLLLGTRITAGIEVTVGLLLLPRQQEGLTYYRRVGLCWWNMIFLEISEQASPEKMFLNGQSCGWKRLAGLFG